jgi:hypothetical protein
LYVHVGVPDARHDLDLLVVRDELPLTERAAAGEAARRSPVEVAKDEARVEAVDLRIDASIVDREPECADPCASGS